MTDDNAQIALALALSLVAGTTGWTFGTRSSRRTGHLDELIKKLVVNKHEMRTAAIRRAARGAALDRHKLRLNSAIVKTQEMLAFCCASNDTMDRENIPLCVERLRNMDKAVGRIDAELDDLQQLEHDLQTQQDFLFEQLAEFAPRNGQQPLDEDLNCISEDIFSSEHLDIIENDLADFAAFLQPSTDSEAQAHVGLGTDEAEAEAMKIAFVELKRRREALLASSPSDTVLPEVNAIEFKLAELGEQLCLRGMPVRNGSLVMQDLVPIDCDSQHSMHQHPKAASTVEHIAGSESGLSGTRTVDDAESMSPSMQPLPETPQAGVLEWSQFEPPNRQEFGYDEPAEVSNERARERQREYTQYLEDNRTRILTWQQNVINDPDSDPNTITSDEDQPTDALAHLREIEVGEWCFDVYDHRSEYDAMSTQMRLATMFRQSREQFRLGVEAELAINPDVALPQDWQDYFERRYEVVPGDTDSKPWL